MGKAYLFILLSVALSLGLSWSFFSWVDHPNRESKEIRALTRRAKKIKRFMPILLEEHEKTTLFVGTSIFHCCLSPQVFDNSIKQQTGFESHSYNLGFRGNMGLGVLAQLMQLKREAGNKKIKLIVMEYSPLSYSDIFASKHMTMLNVTMPNLFFSYEDFLSFFVKYPMQTSYIALNHLLPQANWTRHPSFKKYFSAKTKEGHTFSPPTPFPGIYELWTNSKYKDRSYWNAQTKGRPNFNLPESQESFDQLMADLHQPARWTEELYRFNKGHGLGRRFAYNLGMVRAFIEAVKVAEGIAEKVVLVKLPYSPELQKRYEKHVDQTHFDRQIQTQTKAQIINYDQTFELTSLDYMDPMHPYTKTMDRFLQKLAQDLKPSF